MAFDVAVDSTTELSIPTARQNVVPRTRRMRCWWTTCSQIKSKSLLSTSPNDCTVLVAEMMTKIVAYLLCRARRSIRLIQSSKSIHSPQVVTGLARWRELCYKLKNWFPVLITWSIWRDLQKHYSLHTYVINIHLYVNLRNWIHQYMIRYIFATKSSYDCLYWRPK